MVKDLVPILMDFDTSILAGSVNSSSEKMYTRDFKAYLTYAQTPELAKKASTLSMWRTHLVINTDMSPNTINRMVYAVKQVMAAAAEKDFITHEERDAFKNIVGVKTSALKGRTKITNRVRIPKEVMREMIDSIDTSTNIGIRNKALFLTFATSGLRVKELSRLKKVQIKKSNAAYLLHMYAEEGKNQTEDRDAQISNEAVEAIHAWIEVQNVESEFIFTSFAGNSRKDGERALATPITPQGAWYIVKKIAEPFAPGVKPHDFRRFVGTQLILTKGLNHAQKALGHKSPTTTMKYDLSEVEGGLTNDLF
jgi:integrase